MKNTMTGGDKRRADRINQVLDAAADCFVEYGFHRAGMSKIAKRAGMSVGHIYHYFESKEAIIAAIVDRESAVAAERFSEFDAVNPNELARFMAERAAQSISEKTDIFQSALNLEMLAEGQRNPEIAQIIQRHDQYIRAQLTQILREKLGLNEPEARTDMLMVLFAGLANRVLRHPGLEREKLVPMMRHSMLLILSPDYASAQ
ncbi:TetR/AcrR family transcriptional regulator [Henriciella aquimarina]|uniref:TetR/AcrR family transcriptional regulator n=1 Tax=Henriciella aquimarina TaxID=545261 RepID=UPI000A0733CB|nr:TetR/AcrR family transcriptional regulator [Henriciella aquimarina]